MGKEIERKWFTKSLPEWVTEFPCKKIIQAYLNRMPVIRIRQENDDYYMTYKGEGDIERVEYNLPLNKESFDSLLTKCEGSVIYKTRYFVPVDSNGKTYTAEADIFEEKQKGRIYVEVEFDSAEEAKSFQAPDWFGEDVTGKKGYSNAEISL